MTHSRKQSGPGARPGRTVGAVCRIIMERHAGFEGSPFAAGPEQARAAAAFTQSRIDAAPDFMRFGLRGLGVVFGALTFLRTGRALDRLSKAEQRRRLDAWRHSRVGLFRDYVRLCESLTLFWMYSRAPLASIASDPLAAEESRSPDAVTTR